MPKVTVPFETLAADLRGPDWQKRCEAACLLRKNKDARRCDAVS